MSTTELNKALAVMFFVEMRLPKMVSTSRIKKEDMALERTIRKDLRRAS